MRRWARSWLATRHPVGDQVLAGPAGARAARSVAAAVRDQRPQPGPVGAQRVGQHERVEPVVLVAGRAVAAAQVLDLVRADHHHGEAGAEQGLDDRPVGAFDRDLADAGVGAGTAISSRSPAAVCSTVRRSTSRPRPSTTDTRVVIAGPVQPGGHAVGRVASGRVLLADFTSASSLLVPVGRRPRVAGAGTWLPVRSLIGARQALSPVDGPHVPGNRQTSQISSLDINRVKRAGR